MVNNNIIWERWARYKYSS